MPLRLIAADEVQEVSVAGTIFKVRVRPGAWWEDLRAAHRKNGEWDGPAYRAAAWEGILVGWDKLLKADGAPLEYSAGSVARVAPWLPENAQEAIHEAARGLTRGGKAGAERPDA